MPVNVRVKVISAHEPMLPTGLAILMPAETGILQFGSRQHVLPPFAVSLVCVKQVSGLHVRVQLHLSGHQGPLHAVILIKVMIAEATSAARGETHTATIIKLASGLMISSPAEELILTIALQCTAVILPRLVARERSKKEVSAFGLRIACVADVQAFERQQAGCNTHFLKVLCDILRCSYFSHSAVT